MIPKLTFIPTPKTSTVRHSSLELFKEELHQSGHCLGKVLSVGRRWTEYPQNIPLIPQLFKCKNSEQSATN